MLTYNYVNIERLAQRVVDDMDIEELRQYVYDDLINVMENAPECFVANAAEYMDMKDIP